jgi:hypothetical protein
MVDEYRFQAMNKFRTHYSLLAKYVYHAGAADAPTSEPHDIAKIWLQGNNAFSLTPI